MICVLCDKLFNLLFSVMLVCCWWGLDGREFGVEGVFDGGGDWIMIVFIILMVCIVFESVGLLLLLSFEKMVYVFVRDV